MKGREVIGHIVREKMPDIERVREECHRQSMPREQAKSRPGQVSAKRLFPIAAAVVLVLTVSTTVFALGGFEWFMQTFNPAFGTVVEPVMLYSEDEGIRITVIGAQRFESMAIVYLSIQDISGENRLTAEATFRDGLSARQTQGTAGGSTAGRMIHFDEATNTAYHEIQFTVNPRSSFVDPLTIRAFMVQFGSDGYDEPLNVSLAGLTEAEEIMPIPDGVTIGRMGRGNYSCLIPTPTSVLLPGFYGPLPHGRDDQWISNVGIIDGQLRVQIAQCFLRGEFGPNFPPQIYLIPPGMSSDEAREAYWASSFVTADFYLDADMNLVCINDNRFRELVSYRVFERSFDVDSDRLENYAIGYFGSVTRGVEGDWQVVVDTGDTSQRMIVWTDEVAADALIFEFITLSPLGLQAAGRYTRELTRFPEVELLVETADKIISLPSVSVSVFDGQVGMGWHADTPLDVSEVTAIIIDGVRISRP